MSTNRRDMASCSSSTTENDAARLKKLNQMKCVNRFCKSGDSLTKAFELICSYYNVIHKPNKEVIISVKNLGVTKVWTVWSWV